MSHFLVIRFGSGQNKRRGVKRDTYSVTRTGQREEEEEGEKSNSCPNCVTKRINNPRKQNKQRLERGHAIFSTGTTLMGICGNLKNM